MKKVALCICLLLVFVCLVTVFVLPLSAQDDINLKGTGHYLDPYLIESVDDFLYFRDKVNSGVDFSRKYVLQTVNLDLLSIENLTEIGVYGSGYYFYGVYNGGGHIISNVNIDGDEAAGLFGQLGGTVMNLGIESGNISGVNAAAIACYSEGTDAKILNCYNRARVTGKGVGGIVYDFSGDVVDCWSDGKLVGEEGGQLVGHQASNVISCIALGEGNIFNTASFTGYSDLNIQEEYSEERINSLKESFRNNTKQNSTYFVQLTETALEGDGTRDNPYLIKSLEDLCRFRSLVNIGVSFNGDWVRQELDLDFKDVDNWTPIGDFDTENCFQGIYDGAGHTISNLRIVSDGNVGFFGVLGGTVMNLGIEGGYIEGACVGAIASHGSTAFAPMIVNCYNKAEVHGYRAGGIVDNFETGIIVNCLNSGAIYGVGSYGGITAYGAKRLVNCYSVGMPVRDKNAVGIEEDSCAEVGTVGEATALLNKNLYITANRTDYQHNNLYKWNDDGTFGNVHNFLLRFVIQELLIAICVFCIILCLFVLIRAYKHKNKLCLCGIGTEIKEQKSYWKSGMSNRLKTIVALGFIFGFGMLLVGYLNQDHTITRALFWLDGNDSFMDFINPMSSVLNNNYAQEGHYTNFGSTYPPIARALLWMVGKIIPSNMTGNVSQIKASYGVPIVFFVMALSLVALIFVFRYLSKNKSMLLAIFAAFSAPMIYMVERGNVIIIALLGSALFVAGYRSKNPIIRHLSYMALAVATAIKIYPVVLGVLVLKEKKWKDTLVCVFYGFAFCILPFFFIGGIPEILLYVRNVTTSFGKNAVNINNWLLNYTNVLSGWGDSLFGNADIGRTIAEYTLYPITVLLAFCAFVTKEHWKAVLAVCMIVVLYPGYSSYYCAAFFAIPLMCFLGSEHNRKIDYVYAGGFLLLLAPLQFVCGALGVTQGEMWQFVGGVGVIVAVILIVDCIRSFVLTILRKSKKLSQANVTA